MPAAPVPAADRRDRLAAFDARLAAHPAGRRAVRRVRGEVPAAELVRLDGLHARGLISEWQRDRLDAEDADSLTVGPHRPTARLGPRTLFAAANRGPAVVLKECGEADHEHLRHLVRVTVRHPAFVKPRELIEAGDRLWLVSPHAAGPTLADRLIARGRLEPAAALRLARALAAGLAAAEAAGLLHGEIHAGNVRLAPAGPALVDGGVAPLLPPPAWDPGRGGWAAAPTGPAAYDTATDLSAFGATLWGALAGRPPFLLAPPRFGTVHAHRPPLPPVADLAPETLSVLAELVDSLTGHAEPPGSFAEVADRLKPPRVRSSPVRSAAWLVACGAAGAGILGAASVDPVPPRRSSAPAKPQAAITVEPSVAPDSSPVPRVRRVAVP